ncbi:MAG: MerR family transcriptional regulator [Bacteroidota bacterium]|nr:MerR family transcriptional regulator [Candidatus Kapabacteria bacterium]MDW8220235.1 MerR family transcriptional regulator [Bacteroidota bacterium]
MDSTSTKRLYYSISEVSKLVDEEQYVLRYWESEFEQLRPQKNHVGNRIYTDYDIQVIRAIQYLLRTKRLTIDGAKEHLRAVQDGAVSTDDVQRYSALLYAPPTLAEGTTSLPDSTISHYRTSETACTTALGPPLSTNASTSLLTKDTSEPNSTIPYQQEDCTLDRPTVSDSTELYSQESQQQQAACTAIPSAVTSSSSVSSTVLLQDTSSAGQQTTKSFTSTHHTSSSTDTEPISISSEPSTTVTLCSLQPSDMALSPETHSSALCTLSLAREELIVLRDVLRYVVRILHSETLQPYQDSSS